jgi:hypothetical protein
MTNKDIYKIWSPVHKKWVNWVRPVPFLAINNKTKVFQSSGLVMPFLSKLDKNDKSTAIIVDLPGTHSVEAGILLAQNGYRPIPIYNGVLPELGARATTDNTSVSSALVWGASILSKMKIQDDAPPAFLTDSHRLDDVRVDLSIFDNSWDVYHQDLPSGEYFLKNGIDKVLVISKKSVARDLKEVFAEYPKGKIKILWTDGYEEPKPVKKGLRLFASKYRRDD